MINKTVFIKNAAILTASSLILRFIGIIFKVWLASAIGSQGIGLYQMVFSLYVLAATFATSGICTAVTRLVADELALGSKSGTLKILRKAVLITLIIAFASIVIIASSSDIIAGYLIGDMRAKRAVIILSFSLPFMGVCSCLKGYFIARRNATPGAAAQIFEQIVRIITVVLLVKRYSGAGLEYSCAAVFLGDTAAEISSVAFLYLIYINDRKRLNRLSGRKNPPFSVTRKIGHIALPITAGRYLGSALRTAENMLVPKTLSKYVGKGDGALSQFGMIKGMALPILFFPSTLLNSLSTMLIPEMSEAAARGRKGLVRNAVTRTLQLTALISFIFAALFFALGKEIGMLIYKSGDVGFLLCALSPIVPLMYLDSVSDGLLKGLDQQAFTFRTSVGDSASRILLILIFVPKFGMMGFIGIMYFSNLLTCTLNVGRLIRVSEAEFDAVYTVLLPLAAAFFITMFIKMLIFRLALPYLVYIILVGVLSLTLYGVFIFAAGCIKREDVADIRR